MEVTNLGKFDKAFESLSSVSGFLIAGIYNSQGEVLAATSSSRFNFHEVGGFAIELYRGAKGITDKMGLGTCNFVETHTDNFIFIHSCIVPGKGAMGVLLDKSGNIGLARHLMRKEAQALISEFS